MEPIFDILERITAMARPLSTSAMRNEFANYRCEPSKMKTVSIFGYGNQLRVAPGTEDAFNALSTLMRKHNYPFKESAGGTYNCRKIAGSSNYSLHAYGLCIDINPSKNPYGKPLRHNFPAGLIRDLEAIRTRSGNRQVWQWGGRWNTPDSMHWQIGATKRELASGLIVPGTASVSTQATLITTDDLEDDAMLPLKKGDGSGSRKHKGQDVRALQYLLNHQFACGLKADGIYGSATASAVNAHIGQHSNNGTVVGGEQWGRLLWFVGKGKTQTDKHSH